MDFDEARQALRDQYAAAGFAVVEERDRQIELEYKDIPFVVTEEDINEYVDCQMPAEVGPEECGLVTPDYREQVVQPLDPIRWRYLPPLEMGFVFGDPQSGETYLTVGAATTAFTNFFRFDPVYMEICRERMAHAPVNGSPTDIRRGLYRPPTIRVHGLGKKTIKDALAVSGELIDYCLFELSYLKHLPVGLARQWPARRRMEDDGFKFGGEIEGNVLPLPRVEFDIDVIQFYQLGMASRLPVLQFWAFYQVLERHFVESSDEILHRKLAARLNDPRFKPSSTQLDRVVQDVLDHLGETGDVEMLRHVLEKYVSEEELIAFIREYEEYLGAEHYTRRRRLFGEDLQVRLSPGTVIDNVARTVMTIRHTLVFSADRQSRTSRNIGFDQLAELLEPEIPLMKFLAERVIIGSAL